MEEDDLLLWSHKREEREAEEEQFAVPCYVGKHCYLAAINHGNNCWSGTMIQGSSAIPKSIVLIISVGWDMLIYDSMSVIDFANDILHRNALYKAAGRD